MSSTMVGEARYGLGRPIDQRRHRGRQRHADRPVHRLSRSPARSSATRARSRSTAIRRDHQFVYNLTAQALRTHSFKTGIDIRRQQLDDLADNNLARLLDVQRELRRRHLSDALRRLSRRLRRLVRDRLRALLPRESARARPTSTRRTTGASSTSLTLNLGVRYEYVTAPSEARMPHRLHLRRRRQQLEPRIGVRLDAPRWERRAAEDADRRGDRRASRSAAATGIYDGRIFQSVFSQSGASVRFNPPNALGPHDHHAAGHPQCLGSDARLRLRARAAGRAHASLIAAGSGSRNAVYAPVEHQLRSRAAVELDAARHLQRQPASATLQVFAQGNLPRSPLDGPDHGRRSSEQRAGGRLPGPARQGDRSDRRRCCSAPAPGLPGSGHDGRLPERRADRRQRDQPARAARRTSGGPIRATRTNLLDQQRRRELVRRAARSSGSSGSSHGLAVPGRPTPSARSLDTTSEATFVGAGDTNQRGPNSSFAKGLLALPHAASLHA